MHFSSFCRLLPYSTAPSTRTAVRHDEDDNTPPTTLHLYLLSDLRIAAPHVCPMTIVCHDHQPKIRPASIARAGQFDGTSGEAYNQQLISNKFLAVALSLVLEDSAALVARLVVDVVNVHDHVRAD